MTLSSLKKEKLIWEMAVNINQGLILAESELANLQILTLNYKHFIILLRVFFYNFQKYIYSHWIEWRGKNMMPLPLYPSAALPKDYFQNARNRKQHLPFHFIFQPMSGRFLMERDLSSRLFACLRRLLFPFTCENSSHFHEQLYTRRRKKGLLRLYLGFYDRADIFLSARTRPRLDLSACDMFANGTSGYSPTHVSPLAHSPVCLPHILQGVQRGNIM